MNAHFSLTLLFVLFGAHIAYGEPLLKGSPESQIKQNQIADKSDLVRITNADQLEEMKRSGHLVQIPETRGIKIDDRLASHFRYVRPWVAIYLTRIGKDFHDRFGVDIKINSAVRTIEHQIHLSRRNKNAAPVDGHKRSSHLTGSAIDIAKLPLTEEQRIWLRQRFVADEISHKIEATEEHWQAVFHIMVFPDFDSLPVQTASQ